MPVIHFVGIRWMLTAVETITACAPFLLYKKRRSHFYLRLILALIVLGGATAGLSVAFFHFMDSHSYEAAYQITASVLGYFAFPALIYLLEISLFEEKAGNIFSSVVQGLALRSTAFSLYSVFVTALDPSHNFLNIAGMPNIVNLFPYLGIYITTYFLAIFAMRKVVLRANNTLTKPLLIVYVFVASLVIVCIAIGEFYGANDNALYVCLLLSQVACYVVLFTTDYLLRRNDELTSENELVSRLLEEQGRQFKFSKANAEDLRTKAHDLKHQVKILRAGGEEAEKLLSSLEEDIDDFESTIYLDNQVLNIVLREKWGYCKKHRIRMSYTGDPNAFSTVSSVDLFTLIGNILDNAIEASMKLQDKSRRIISASIYHQKGISTFRCDNFYEGEIKMEDGRFITQKGDDLNHGLGIQSIKRITKKYGGTTDIQTQNGIFVIKVAIPDEK
ncbi:MAG: GHKL domain-containing protein [Bacilli bacterium]|nr:GHKL domain-containing protein [Bacilli bacterium]